MKNFLIALQFLTIIPVRMKHINETQIQRSVIYFPLVGLLLGLILVGASKFLSILGFGQFSINIIVVLLLIILTGGIHLDGLADTADAFLSRKNKEEILKIMRDSHIGVMGVLGIIIAVLLKIAFLSSMNTASRDVSLLLMCILSRWALIFSMFLFPYARHEGKAKGFIQGTNLKIFTISTIITLCCVIITGKAQGLLTMAIVALFTYALNKFINNKIGGITGDTLGATNELMETSVLFSICILAGASL